MPTISMFFGIIITVKTCFDSIEWDNVADFDPEILYQKNLKID
jgi:hypothetical protein